MNLLRIRPAHAIHRLNWVQPARCFKIGTVVVSSKDEQKRVQRERRYPPFWERAVPVMVAVIAIVITALLVIAILVALGMFPGSA